MPKSGSQCPKKEAFNDNRKKFRYFIAIHKNILDSQMTY